MRMFDKLYFTLISTLWIVIVYSVSKKCGFIFNSFVLTTITLIVIPFLLSLIWLLFVLMHTSSENISKCIELKEISNDFLPSYLGYFFVGLSINDDYVFIVVYIIIFVFTAASQKNYFNPVLLVLGYKYYSATTSEGTTFYLISRHNYRNSEELKTENIKRINNYTYIEKR